MGTLLIDGWLEGFDPAGVIDVLDDASVSQVREAVRARAAALAEPAREGLVAAASELARNQLAHARSGWVAVRAVERGGVVGVEVVAADRGPGLADPTAALRGEGRSTGSLGVGLSAVVRLTDEVDFDVRQGEGTCVRARKFAAPVPRSLVAVLGRPHPDEPKSGDHAGFVRDGDTLVVGVVDGLGHGPAARVAADAAIVALRQHHRLAPADLLARADHALEGTRGAVMSVVRFDGRAHELEHAGTGNVGGRVLQPGRGTAFACAARVLGSRQPQVRIPVERVPFAPLQTLVLFTDGVSSRADLAADSALLRDAPLAVAHAILARHARDSDDALVLVARHGG